MSPLGFIAETSIKSVIALYTSIGLCAIMLFYIPSITPLPTYLPRSTTSSGQNNSYLSNLRPNIYNSLLIEHQFISQKLEYDIIQNVEHEMSNAQRIKGSGLVVFYFQSV